MTHYVERLNKYYAAEYALADELGEKYNYLNDVLERYGTDVPRSRNFKSFLDEMIIGSSRQDRVLSIELYHFVENKYAIPLEIKLERSGKSEKLHVSLYNKKENELGVKFILDGKSPLESKGWVINNKRGWEDQLENRKISAELELIISWVKDYDTHSMLNK